MENIRWWKQNWRPGEPIKSECIWLISESVVGDTTYGSRKQKFRLDGQALHARKLGFLHPVTGQYMEFEAPIPGYFEELLKLLRKISKILNSSGQPVFFVVYCHGIKPLNRSREVGKVFYK